MALRHIHSLTASRKTRTILSVPYTLTSP